MRKTKKVAVIAGCMLIYSSFAAMAAAEEANNSDTTLEEVVVTGSKLNPLKIPVKMTVITADEIKAKGAQTVAAALKDVAGLYVTGSNVKGKGVAQIRGSDANSTKVIIDGVMINGGGDGRADLSIIPTENIEKIEIFKGPVPVIYGANATGGVIFITTKNATGKTSGALTIARGSWDTDIGSFSFSGNAGKANYYFTEKLSNTAGYDDNPKNIGGYKKNTADKSQYFNGKFKWDFNPKASLTVFGSYSDETKELPNRYGYNVSTGKISILPYPGSGGTLTSRNNYFGGGNAFGVNQTTYNWAYDPIKESYIGAVYNQKLNNNNDLSLKVYRSTLKSLLTTQGLTASNGYQRVEWDGSTNGYELQHTIKTSRANTATWGYSYETRSFVELTPYDSSYTNRGDYDYTSKSFYIQDAININSQLAASFGYRHDKVNDGIIVDTKAFPTYGTLYHYQERGVYTSDVPVISLNYNLSKNTAIHGSFGKSFRSPNAMERSAPLYTTVKPEEGINREVGLESSTKSGLGFDVTYFSRDITNMIKGGGAGGGRTQYYNIPNVEMHGFEAEISKKFNKQIKGFVNYSYTNAYDTLMHMQVSDIPYRKFSYGLNYTEKGLTANLAVNYVGPVRSMYSQGNGNGNSDGNSTLSNTPYAYWGTKNLPGYHTVDLKVSKTIKNTEYYVKVLNLLDQQYYTASYLVAPGRYIEIGTTIKF